MSDLTNENDEEPEIELTEEEKELKYKKDKAQRCKVIALHRLGHHPIKSNVSNFNSKAKNKVLGLVRELFDLPDEVITQEFNDIVLEVVFDKNEEFSQYPVYTTQMQQNKD
jgi:hypothetical protein